MVSRSVRQWACAVHPISRGHRGSTKVALQDSESECVCVKPRHPITRDNAIKSWLPFIQGHHLFTTVHSLAITHSVRSSPKDSSFVQNYEVFVGFRDSVCLPPGQLVHVPGSGCWPEEEEKIDHGHASRCRSGCQAQDSAPSPAHSHSDKAGEAYPLPRASLHSNDQARAGTSLVSIFWWKFPFNQGS